MLLRTPLLVGCLLAAVGILSDRIAQAQVLGIPAIVQPTQAPVPQTTAAAGPTFSPPSTRTQRQLQQADALAEEAAAQGTGWDEYFELLDTITAAAPDATVELAPGAFASLSVAIQHRLLKLPEAGLAAYRARVDSLAAQWLEQGRATADAKLLERVATELAASSAADDALWSLGELALAAGDVTAARRHWQRIHPQLVGPSGKSIGAELRGVDLAKHGEKVRAVLTNPPPCPTLLICRDADVPLAQVLAALVVASVRELDLPRAERELALLRLLEPKSTGLLGGKSTELVPALESLIASTTDWQTSRGASDWSTWGGNLQRSGAAGPVDKILAPLWASGVAVPALPAPTQQQQNMFGVTLPTSSTGEEGLSVTPLVSGRWLLYRAGNFLRAIDFVTGKSAITADGVLLEESTTPTVTQQRVFFNNPGGVQLRVINGVVMPVNTAVQASVAPGFPLTVHGDVLYSLIAEPSEAQSTPQGFGGTPPLDRRQLVGLDLTRDALRVAEVSPPSGVQFGGPPVVLNGRAYVVLRASQLRPQVSVACYAVASGRELWRTKICTGQPLATERSTGTDLLSLAGDTLYLNTNLGAIAAVSARDGQIRWLRTYSRAADTLSVQTMQNMMLGAVPLQSAATEAPCMIERGRVVVKPTDSREVLCLDAASGALLWKSTQPKELRLLGVARGSVALSGDFLLSLDLETGHSRFQWPDTQHAGLRGYGQGCLAGDEVFWPTRNTIYAFDLSRGELSRPPIDISALTSEGANLAAAHGCLIVAGTKEMNVWAPYQAAP